MPTVLSLSHLAIVFLGGGAGSVLRFCISTLVAERFGTAFPAATLGINVGGSFCIGAVVALAGEQIGVLSPSWRLLLAVGFCGGFTTFSTFSLEIFTMLQSGRTALAAMYAAASLSLCVLGTASGLGMVYWYWKRFGA